MIIVYCAENRTTGKRYVGITRRSVDQRISDHLNWSRKKSINTPFHRSIVKYGISDFTWSKIDSALTWSEACLKESNWIKRLGTMVPKGYNLTAGGEGGTGYRHSEAAKVRIAKANTGKILSDETKRRISESQKGKKISDECRSKMREARKGKSSPYKGHQSSTETKNKISRALKGVTFSDDHCRRISIGLLKYYRGGL